MANKAKTKTTAKVSPALKALTAAAENQFKGASYALLTAGSHSIPVARLASYRNAETLEEFDLVVVRRGKPSEVPLASEVTSLVNSDLKKDPNRGFVAARSCGFVHFEMEMEHYEVINADLKLARRAHARKTLALEDWLDANKTHAHAMSITNQFQAVVRSFSLEELKATLDDTEKIGEWVVANPPKSKKKKKKAEKGKVVES